MFLSLVVELAYYGDAPLAESQPSPPSDSYALVRRGQPVFVARVDAAHRREDEVKQFGVAPLVPQAFELASTSAEAERAAAQPAVGVATWGPVEVPGVASLPVAVLIQAGALSSYGQLSGSRASDIEWVVFAWFSQNHLEVAHVVSAVLVDHVGVHMGHDAAAFVHPQAKHAGVVAHATDVACDRLGVGWRGRSGLELVKFGAPFSQVSVDLSDSLRVGPKHDFVFGDRAPEHV